MEKSLSRSDHGRSSSKYSREQSSSSSYLLPREKSSRMTAERSVSRISSSEKRSHRDSSHANSRIYPDQTRRVIESSPEPQASTSSTVVAGVDLDPSVSKMLKKIVAKTEKKKKTWKNEKLELVLRKPKKKKSKKSKADLLGSIKAEPVTDTSPPSRVNIKTEPGTASPPSPPPPPLPPSQSLPYFKPGQEVELQPILGHSKCRICKSYFPDADDRRNQHLAQHPDRVFLVILPVDTFYYDMEEAISHMAKFGINRTELQQKVKDCNLIKLPTNLKGFSCDICKMLDTNSEKEFMIHVKEECKVMVKEERAQHLVCFCRGCHARFSNKTELERHVRQGGCWPSMMVINRLYDMCAGEVAPKQKDKAVMEREKMIRIKQEKVERAQQIQVKREMFEEREQALPQLAPMPPQAISQFNAYSLPSSQEAQQPAPSTGPSTTDLQNILQSLQHNQVMQATSHMQQMDMQGIQQLQQMQFPPPSFLPQQMNFTVPPPSLPQVSPSTTRHMVKVERSKSPSLADLLQSRDEPSPAFSPVRDSHSQRSRSRIPEIPSLDLSESHRARSRRPSTPSVAPPAPSTPLPTLDDLFTAGSSSSRRQRCPSGDSIVSCDSLSQQSTKTVSTYNCQRSACLWTDPHTSTCSKLTIMARCSKDSCDWYSLHRNYPLCDKLSFYCNCKKEREGVYKYYDSLPQVKDIPTKVEGSRDLSVKEQKYVVMRLLYRMVSNVVGDPRLSQSCYPTRHNIPARSFRGKKGSRRGWGENNVICTWSGISMVVVSTENNPHIDVSDHDSDVELCEEEVVIKGRKITKRKDSGSSQEREVW